MSLSTTSVSCAGAALSGLSRAEAEQSRAAYGRNTFTRQKRKNFALRYLESFGDPIIKVLLAALAINVLLLFRHQNWFETVGIALAAFLATFVSTLSEYGSESAFIRLQEEAAKTMCRVRRKEGLLLLPVAEVVTGDIVLLQAGEKVPADGILLSGELHLDQSAINGESKEALKTPLPDSPKGWNPHVKNQLFQGTVVTSGEGVMSVCHVGDNTLYGSLAGELQSECVESPMKARLAALAKTISRLGYTAALLVAFADLYNALVVDNAGQWPLIAAELHNPPLMLQNLMHAVLLAISVVVVAVPEGLPMMITVVLSSNMLRMQKEHVMVRKLVGIETAGSLSILFTDKTGTLTDGKLSVETLVTGDGRRYGSLQELHDKEALKRLVCLSCHCNSGASLSGKKVLGGNSTERALLSFAASGTGLVQGVIRLKAQPFDSARKYSWEPVEYAGKRYVLVKGAPEKLLPRCSGYYDAVGNRRPGLPPALRAQLNDMTRRAMRVLLLAIADNSGGQHNAAKPAAPDRASGVFAPDKTSNAAASGRAADGFDPETSELTFLAFAGIRDSLRPEVPQAVQTVRAAGIQTVMITGDNQETAVAVAKEAGIYTGAPEELVVTGDGLNRMSDELLRRKLPHLRVVARALPTDKSRLVRLSQELGLVVGMTGDGINDAPALKKADVGFAMGSGTQVAREAGDIVILDDRFASITEAILYGRTIFKSIRKFLVFQLTMNLCAVGVSFIAPFIGIDTPVTVVQMLWINMIMDTLAGLAFAGERPQQAYMQEPPKSRLEPILTGQMLEQIFITGGFTILLCTSFLWLPQFRGAFHYRQDFIAFMTAFFTLFIFCGIFNAFNARTHGRNLFAHLWGNSSFITIMTLVSLIQFLLIRFGGSLFRTHPMGLRDTLSILLLASSVIPFDLLRKTVLRAHDCRTHRKRRGVLS